MKQAYLSAYLKPQYVTLRTARGFKKTKLNDVH